jgi:hypothetical protein
MTVIKPFSFFPIIRSADKDKRLLYLIQAALQPKNQLIVNLPPQFVDLRSTSATEDSTDALPQSGALQIDQSGGTSATYGIIIGAVDGTNKVFSASLGIFQAATFEMYKNGQLLNPGAGQDYVQTDPDNGIVTFATAPLSTDELTMRYQPIRIPLNIIKDQSGGTDDTYGAIAGTIDGGNDTFTVSNKIYVSGTLAVFKNGILQIQGSAEDYIELAPGSGTFQFNTAPIVGDELTAEYLVDDSGWKIDSSDSGLTGAIDGANTRYTTSVPYVPGTLNYRKNGQTGIEGTAEDFVETNPWDGLLDANVAPVAGDYLEVLYMVATTATLTVARSDDVNEVSASYAAAITDDTIDVDASGGAVSITLPAVADFTGHHIRIRKNDSSANAVTIVGTVNGAVNPTLIFRYDAVDLAPNSTEWMIL